MYDLYRRICTQHCNVCAVHFLFLFLLQPTNAQLTSQQYHVYIKTVSFYTLLHVSTFYVSALPSYILKIEAVNHNSIKLLKYIKILFNLRLVIRNLLEVTHARPAH
jgi:hypothetical protein